MLHEITDETFAEEVAASAVPCVMLFTAGWCTFCDDMVPRMEGLAEEFGDAVKFCIANTDEQRGLRIAFAVGAVPYIVMVRDGMKIPLFDEVVTEQRLGERIRFILDGGQAPTASPLKPIR